MAKTEHDAQTTTKESEALPTFSGTDEEGDASKGASRSPAKGGSSNPRTGSATAAAQAKGGAKAASTAKGSDAEEPRAVRRVRLTLSAVDPFSVMKLSFLIAIAIGIATVVAVVLLWNIVNAMGIWSSIDSLGRDLTGGDPLPFMEFLTFSKFASYGTVVAAVNVVIITALGTLLAFLYNIVAALLGGLSMTFTDD